MLSLSEEERLELFNENQGLAHYLAFKYNHGLDLDDTKQEAALGLWVATERYDDTKGAFGSYASYIITSHLQSYLSKNRQAVHVPKDRDFLAVKVDIDSAIAELPTHSQDIDLIDLKRAISNLPIELRSLYVLSLQGFSTREIGVKIKMSHTKVNNLLRHAREIVKENA